MATTEVNLGPLQQTKGYTVNPSSTGVGDLPAKIALLISNIIGFLTILAGLAFLIYFILGAVNWLTSAGDPQKLKTAQQMLLNAIIGIIITVIAYPVIQLLATLLGIPFTSPLELIRQITFSAT